MGVNIKDLIKAKEIKVSNLKGKIICIDASLFLYQFISSIRQRDGMPLKDSEGRITSHLSGVFSRSAFLMQNGIKLIWVFDGTPPELKQTEREKRRKKKEEAEVLYEKAKNEGNISNMRKYASRTSRLSKEMVEETKELISAMGIPIVQAPSEGEAQASYMVKKGDAFAVATQDADAFLFGADKVIKNLSSLGRKKISGKLGYKKVNPEFVELASILNELGIDNDQLIILSMLIGTDYNEGGIKGIGPKNALKIVKEFGKDFDGLMKKVEWDKFINTPWNEIFYLFKKIPTTDDYYLEWKEPSESLIYEIMVNRHSFSKERIKSSVEKIKEEMKPKQKSLLDF